MYPAYEVPQKKDDIIYQLHPWSVLPSFFALSICQIQLNSSKQMLRVWWKNTKSYGDNADIAGSIKCLKFIQGALRKTHISEILIEVPLERRQRFVGHWDMPICSILSFIRISSLSMHQNSHCVCHELDMHHWSLSIWGEIVIAGTHWRTLNIQSATSLPASWGYRFQITELQNDSNMSIPYARVYLGTSALRRKSRSFMGDPVGHPHRK